MPAIHEILTRGRRAVERHGLRGTLELAIRRAWARAARVERHVWYALDLASMGPAPAIPPGLVLRAGEESDAPLLDELESISSTEAVRRLRAGNALWLVLEGSRPLFSCWIFDRTAPTIAAARGYVPLPADVACLEDSVTAPAARGRGIAPAAWLRIAESLRAVGRRQLITKVAVDNAPSRRAVEKAGFVAIALMRFRRIGTWKRTSVEVLDRASGWLAEALAPHPGAGTEACPP